MNVVLGFEFCEGPEVPPPRRIDYTLEPEAVEIRRREWAAVLDDQIRYHNAWGTLVLKPNLDVVLFDVGSTYRATTWGGTAFLLLARDVPPNYVATCDAGECNGETAATVLTEDGWLSMCGPHAAAELTP